jgi:hypothetical protein
LKQARKSLAIKSVKTDKRKISSNIVQTRAQRRELIWQGIMAANPIPFALFPGEADAIIIDFPLQWDMKHFKMAIKGLDTKFDLKPKGLKVLLESGKERSNICARGVLLTIPVDGKPPVTNNITRNYGIVSLKQCRNHATTYVSNQDRKAQDSAMLYQLLSNLVTD